MPALTFKAKSQEFSSDNTFALSSNKLNRKDSWTEFPSKQTYLTVPPSVSASASSEQQSVVVRTSFTAVDFLSNESIAKQHLYEISESSFGSRKFSTDRKEKQRWLNVCIINNSVTTIAVKIYRHLFQ
ncbi:hypothetical protein [Pollutibacter soli]|uniref:hypothetical protein n=1 Tax=Pollutibacter soli TaxID=3034157 RepID=UPI003013F543